YEDYAGSTDDAPATATVNAYVAVMENALQIGGPPLISTGKVNHRPVHEGNVCTSGTACVVTGKDSSFADMIDVGLDADGRVGVVYMDNYGTFGDTYEDSGQKGGPFVHFAKEVTGPSLLDGKPPVA